MLQVVVVVGEPSAPYVLVMVLEQKSILDLGSLLLCDLNLWVRLRLALPPPAWVFSVSGS